MPGTLHSRPSRSHSTTRPTPFATSIRSMNSSSSTFDPTNNLSKMSSAPRTLREASCADDYDPNSMPVAKARELIASFLAPVTAVEHLHVRAALGRVLASDVVSPIAVPGHDNSAMDGYAVRFADLHPTAETVLRRVGDSFAGKPWSGASHAGECVRIFTGGVMPQGSDTTVMQERAAEDERGVPVAAGAV